MIYTRTNLKNAVWDQNIDSNIANIIDVNTIMNNAVRNTNNDLDLRSTKRWATLAPNLFNDIYSYGCPSDLKGIKLIDVAPQTNRSRTQLVELVSLEEFDRRKSFEKYLVAFNDHDAVRKLMIAEHIVNVGASSVTVSVAPLENTTSGGGTWVAYGDGTNLRADLVNFVAGNGSLEWDINASGGTTAGVSNTGLNTFDLTPYIGAGSLFVWAYITSTSNLTNYKLRVGNDITANYYEMTVTTTNEGTAFAVGWNLLRFDLNAAVLTGTVTLTTCDSVALFMTKAAGKVSETNYRFNNLIMGNGAINNVIYYSKFGWQNSSGTYLENSTADSDLLNADTDEFDLIVKRCRMEQDRFLKEWDSYKIDSSEYVAAVKDYKLKYPSEAKQLTQTYHDIPDGMWPGPGGTVSRILETN